VIAMPGTLHDVARRMLPHPAVRHFPLSAGAHPAGLFLDEERGVLVVVELGTRRLVLLDAREGQELDRIPLTAAVDPDLRERSIGGALLPGRPGQAYLWTMVTAGELRRLDLTTTASELQGHAFAGPGLLVDWLFDPASGVTLAARGDPFLYVMDADLRTSHVVPLAAPADRVVALPGARTLVLLRDDAETVCVVDTDARQAVRCAAPWSRLAAFTTPPPRGPHLSSASLAVTSDGRRGYLGCHRTDEAGWDSPIVAITLPQLDLDTLTVDGRLTRPTRLALHPSGEELYVSGQSDTLILDARTLEVTDPLGPGRLITFTLSPSGDRAVGVDFGHETAYLFDGPAQATFTAPLRPDVDPSELLDVPVVISEALGNAYVADRFADAVVVLPLSASALTPSR
jgi:hypothetical protein